MKRFIGIVILSCLCVLASAQQGKTPDEIQAEKDAQARAAKGVADTVKTFGWKHSMVTGLNLTQVSFKDWVGGGDNALAYTAWLKGQSVQDLEQTEWANSYEFAFGQTRLASQGLRKTDDQIYLQSLFIYKVGTQINPYLSATLRTQFSTGYNYTDTNSLAISKFFDPAYLTQSIGLAYQPIPEITTRLGVGAREIITSEYAQYYAPPGVDKVQGGLESITDIHWNFAENMTYTGKLEMFAGFKTMDQIIVHSDNTITAKVNKYINVNFTLQLINDVTASPLTQIKEGLALGISYILM